jgi:arylsulfatase A-like enzyme
LDRREFLRSGVAAIGAAALCLKGASAGGSQAKTGAKPPNIMFIMSDDQGWGDLSLNWPQTNVRLPELEKIGRNGIRFAEFHTEPLCGPSRASVFTGQYSMENGMWRGPGSAKPGENNYRGIKRDVVMLPQLLKRAGYVTGIFGKWHLGEHEGERPNDRGFDEFYGFLRGAHTYRLTPSTPTFFHDREQYCENAHSTDYITDKSLDFIRTQAGHNKSFFCYVSYNAVHGPLWREDRKIPSAPKEWLDKAAARAIDFPRRDYVAILEHMDWNIGRLMRLLRELRIEQETLVVFMSDNGALTMTGESAGKARYPGNNGPYRGGKGTVYQGGLKVPCLMQWKGTFGRGLVSADLVMHVDLFSTILDVAGIDIPRMNGKNPVWGISLVSHIMSGCERPLPDRTMFFELMGRVGARKGNDKLVSGQLSSTRGRWKEHVAELKSRQMEFYDLSTDVAESENLHHKRPESYLRLRDETVKFFDSIRAE